MELLRYLPLAYISWFLGLLANLPLPRPLARFSIRLFADAYKIDPLLATRPLDSFRSIGEFFTRDLRPELRPIGQGLVSPVDGKLRAVNQLKGDGDVEYVKGRAYSLHELLDGDPLISRLALGELWNLYLSPQDAHHIHAPLDGTIVRTVAIPGKLWPVNDWALSSVDKLFAVNERVVTFMETAQGLVAVVMVGATNVGRISLAYLDLETNLRPWSPKKSRVITHDPGIPVSKGQKIGTFKMGSSVVLLTERAFLGSQETIAPREVRYGEPLVG